MSNPALVIAAHSNHGIARRNDGELVDFNFPRGLTRPLPGDRAILNADATLARLVERKSEFGRGDSHGRFRALAANLDRLVIIIAPEPAPSPDILHRYLAAAHIQDMDVIIAVNKSDLVMPDQPPFSDLEDLENLGYPIRRIHCKPTIDILGLDERLGAGTSLLAGQSGVGKSTLLNALIPDLQAQTGELSRVTGKGTHTTSATTLHRLPSGGWVVDTPGVWEYSLWAMPIEELQRGFPEFNEFAGQCRFRDCHHDHEPGCAIREAAENNRLPAFRYHAWLRLLTEQKRLVRLSGTRD